MSGSVESGYGCGVQAGGYVGVALRLTGLWLVAFSLLFGSRTLDMSGAVSVGPACPCGQAESAAFAESDCLKPAAMAHGALPCDADCPSDCPDCSWGSGPMFGVLGSVTPSFPSVLASPWDWAFVDVLVNGDQSGLFRPPRALS